MNAESHYVKFILYFLDNILNPRIAYVPLSSDFSAPGDRRRFCHFAERRRIPYEVAVPGKSYDLVILTQRADLSVWAEYPKNGCRLVYDFIDSYLSVPRFDLRGILRGAAKYVKGESSRLRLNHHAMLERMCMRADAVVCSTPEQEESIRRYCSNVHQILDFHSMIGGMKSDYSPHAPFRLIWEGLPENLSGFRHIAHIFGPISAKFPLEFHFVTNLRPPKGFSGMSKRAGLRMARKFFPAAKFHEWSEAALRQVAETSDLAVIPIEPRDPLMMGKPENRLLLFWRLGVPVLTSATRAYSRVMSAVGLPYSCSSPEEWGAKLQELIQSQSSREHAALTGRSYAESKCSEQALLDRWDSLFATLKM